MDIFQVLIIFPGSLPSRERGLKSRSPFPAWLAERVAPFAGAWIEILRNDMPFQRCLVAPFAGAWIEISLDRLSQGFGSMSLPSRERGLKLGNNGNPNGATVSLPSRERGLKLREMSATVGVVCRSLRGSVD